MARGMHPNSLSNLRRGGNAHPEGKPRSSSLTVRLTPLDKQALEYRAAQCGLSTQQAALQALKAWIEQADEAEVPGGGVR